MSTSIQEMIDYLNDESSPAIYESLPTIYLHRFNCIISVYKESSGKYSISHERGICNDVPERQCSNLSQCFSSLIKKGFSGLIFVQKNEILYALTNVAIIPLDAPLAHIFKDH